MLSISPSVSLALNALLAAVTTIGASSSSDPTTQKVIVWAGAVTSAVNIFLHAFSAATAGPLAPTPPPAKS